MVRILVLAIWLLLATSVEASKINIPMKLDYQFLQHLLLEQVYTDQDQTARVFGERMDCSTLVLSDPKIGHDVGRIRIVTKVEAQFGYKIAGHCWHIPEWQGFIEVFQEPTIVSEQSIIEFRVVESNLLDREENKPLVTGTLWNWITQHVHPRLATLKVDLATSLQEIQTFIPLILTPAGIDNAQPTLESLMFSSLEITTNGIVMNLQLGFSEMASQPSILPAEPVLTAEEVLRWEVAWKRWDAFLTFVIKQVAKDTDQSKLRQALLRVLLQGRYDLTEALISWKEGAPDPVRGLFLKSWERLSPILQRMETNLPGAVAIRYLSFVTAADALKAMDQVSKQFSYEISANGLRRMARMLSPEFDEDPLIYRLDVDLELRRLFNFGPPLSVPDQAHDIDSKTWFFFTPAWAAGSPDHTLARKLNQWVPDASEIRTYLSLVGELLDHVVDATIQSKDLAAKYHDFFRHLSLATAWQESCWRQFIKRSGQLETLKSRAGAVGIMQVNPNVWRGFYEIRTLHSDISYNAMAGNEILHHYFTDYVLAKEEHKRRRSLDHLARLTYTAYNGGPSYFERYRKKSASKAIHQIATVFWQKYQAIKTSGSLAVASCYGQS